MPLAITRITAGEFSQIICHSGNYAHLKIFERRNFRWHSRYLPPFGKYIMRNAECGISTTYNLWNIRCGKKLAEFGILCSVTKVVVCYFLNKRVAAFISFILRTDSQTFCTCNSAKYTWSNSAFRIPQIFSPTAVGHSRRSSPPNENHRVRVSVRVRG